MLAIDNEIKKNSEDIKNKTEFHNLCYNRLYFD